MQTKTLKPATYRAIKQSTTLAMVIITIATFIAIYFMTYQTPHNYVNPKTLSLIAFFAALVKCLTIDILDMIFFKSAETFNKSTLEIVNKIAKKANITIHHVAHIPKNFLSFQDFFRKNTIVIDIQEHDKDKLKSYIAHEIAHIAHNDSKIMPILSLAKFSLKYYAILLFFSALYEKVYINYLHDETINFLNNYMLAIATSMMAFFIGNIIYAQHLQAREYLADLKAVQLTEDLGSFIKALNAQPEIQDNAIERMFSEHPTNQKRMKFIEENYK